jgi:hypothetical protein
VSIRQDLVRRDQDGPDGGPDGEGEPTMSEYLILIYDGTSWENANQQEAERITAGHTKFAENNGAAMRGGNALEPASTATTVAPDGSGEFTVTDGPFAETKEALGGYYLVEAADLDAAIEIAKQIPVIGGALEVRPIKVYS